MLGDKHAKQPAMEQDGVGDVPLLDTHVVPEDVYPALQVWQTVREEQVAQPTKEQETH